MDPPQPLPLLKKLLLCSVMTASDLILAFTQLYEISLLEIMGVPENYVSLYPILAGTCAILIMIFLGPLTDKGDNHRKKKVALMLFNFAVCLLGMGLVVVANSMIFNDVSPILNNTVDSTNETRNSTRISAAGRNRTMSLLLEVEEEEEPEKSGVLVIAVVGVVGFSCIDAGIDANIAAIRAVVLAHTPQHEHASLLLLSLVMAAMGGCITCGLGLMDLTYVFTLLDIVDSEQSGSLVIQVTVQIFISVIIIIVCIITTLITAATTNPDVSHDYTVTIATSNDTAFNATSSRSNDSISDCDSRPSSDPSVQRRVPFGETLCKEHKGQQYGTFDTQNNNGQETAVDSTGTEKEHSETNLFESGVTLALDLEVKARAVVVAATTEVDLTVTQEAASPGTCRDKTKVPFPASDELTFCSVKNCSSCQHHPSSSTRHLPPGEQSGDDTQNCRRLLVSLETTSFDTDVNEDQRLLLDGDATSILYSGFVQGFVQRLCDLRGHPKFNLVLAMVTGYFGSSVLYSYNQFAPDFLGRVVMGGNPYAPKNSAELEEYEDGVGQAAGGLFLFWCSYAFFNVFLHRTLLKFWGLKVDFCLAHLLMATAILTLTLSENMATYYVTSVIYGFQRAVLFSVPFIVANDYVQRQAGQSKTARVMGWVSCTVPMYYCSLFLVSGPLNSLTGYPGSPLLVASVCSFLAALLFLLVKVDDAVLKSAS